MIGVEITGAQGAAATGVSFGFGGWLWAFFIFAALRVALSLFNVFDNTTALAGMYGAENVGIIRIQMIARALLFLPFLILTPLQHPYMPRLTILCLWANAVLALAFGYLVGLPIDRLASVVLAECVIALSFTSYLLMSRRVQLTYAQVLPSAAP